ncbi:unannotated protein [freshwater metagenome]|uniref:Unannotated protein n=1 Tax=freshwater metagenome TaxID=449393 RepID=A0A6J6JHL7_9ZZZZ|nr:hypothetical protein [Actinomycetota bacterium]
MVRGLLFLFGAWLLFTVFVTVFAASADKNEVRNLPKWLWILICLFVPLIGGLLYLALGRPFGRPNQRFGRTRTVAPDDDPAFLRDLADQLDAKEEKTNPINPEDQDPTGVSEDDPDTKDKS